MTKVIEFLKKAQVYIAWIAALVAMMFAFLGDNPFPQPEGDNDSTSVEVPK